MNNCPCCLDTMLRHIRHNEIYWYCPSCRQEMPNFTANFTTMSIDKSSLLINIDLEKKQLARV